MTYTIFDEMYPRFKIDKPIRLIELFAGIGSQAKALENLGANFEHYKVVEFDKYAVASYNAVHGTAFETQDITQIHAENLEIVEREIHIHSYIFIPMPRFKHCRKAQGNGKRQRHAFRAALGS